MVAVTIHYTSFLKIKADGTLFPFLSLLIGSQWVQGGKRKQKLAERRSESREIEKAVHTGRKHPAFDGFVVAQTTIYAYAACYAFIHRKQNFTNST
ncbi:MAG: hypothetical protein U0M41_02340 [Negativibacillus sp.]|jgi:hypothetical protein|nr:hypothetical protein [Clostridium sp.]MEE0782658.1 hypothetical protein [Negativibacillus sp.]